VTIVLVGLDYRTTPLELRECLHLTGEELQALMSALQSEALAEVVVLSTCNRLEVYASAPEVDHAVAALSQYLSQRVSLPSGSLRQHLRVLTDQRAVHHLMRVTCGLESLVLGESEILGQVADAFKQAQRAGTTGAVLSRLFQQALRVGKRARTETAISQHRLSVSHVAVLLAQQQIPNLANASALVVGAGRMAELAVRALKARGVEQVRVLNRTFSKASDLASRTSVEAIEWGQLRVALSDADIVIAATSAQQPIVSLEDIAPRDRKLIMIDIAVPRNVQPGIGKLSNVQLYDMDDLQSVVAEHSAMRLSEVGIIETKIADEREAFFGWLNSRRAVPTIVSLRQQADSLAEVELRRALRRLPDLSERERDVLEQMAHRIVHKLLHAPTTALRERASSEDPTYLHTIRHLFDLEAAE
jgi:glutamyl-tRNA reductase